MALYDDETPDNDPDKIPSIVHENALAEKEEGLADSAGSPPAGTSALDSGSLASAEQAGDQPNDTSDNKLGRGYRPEHGKRLVRQFATKKGFFGLMGAGGALLIILLMWSGFSAFELINMRENLLGFQNRFANHVLQRRRAGSFANMLRKMNQGTFAQNINKKNFQKAFRDNGFKVEFGEDGKLKEFGFTDSEDTYRKFDLEAKDTVKATDDFFGTDTKGGSFGREVSRAYDRTLNARGALWRGPFARSMYRLYGFLFYDWPDRKNASKKPPDGPKEELNDKLRHAADEVATEAIAAKPSSALASEHAYEGADGKVHLPETLDTALQMSAGVDNNNIGSNDYAQRLKDDPSLGDEVLGLGTDTNVDDYGDKVVRAVQSGADELSLRDLAKAEGPKIPGKILKGVGGGLNIANDAALACEIKGTLNFVSNVRNVLMSIELAKFAVLWLSAADNQKAGVLTSTGLNLLMIYLHTPSPYGTYWGVLQSGQATQGDRSRLGQGRNNDGLLGKITAFVNGVPGANKCKIVNNGFVVAGGFAIGIAAAIFSGGSELIANIATGVTLSLIQELAFQIATPLLIKAGAHMVFNGFENSTTVGAGILGGFDSLAAMDNGANGMRAVTKPQLSQLKVAVAEQERYDRRQESMYDRYINPENGTSLVARLGMAMPKNFFYLQNSIASTGFSIFNRMSNFGILSALIPGSAQAAADELNPSGLSGDQTCTDPQVVKNNIATDTFCVPVMAYSPDLMLNDSSSEAILHQYGLIDDSETPTDQAPPTGGLSFKAYVDNCFRGRPGILYTADPDKEGNASPEDDTCVISGNPLPGDFVTTEDENHKKVKKPVGVYDRYSQMWGYIVDRDTFIDQVGDE